MPRLVGGELYCGEHEVVYSCVILGVAKDLNGGIDSSLPGSVTIPGNGITVILNKVENLIKSICYFIGILWLKPQNDIVTQPVHSE